jgi:hypothetical protein
VLDQSCKSKPPAFDAVLWQEEFVQVFEVELNGVLNSVAMHREKVYLRRDRL